MSAGPVRINFDEHPGKWNNSPFKKTDIVIGNVFTALHFLFFCFVLKPKYFDSGDYNMAKAKMNNPKKPLAANEKMYLQESIGETIPTADNLHLRKPSIVTSKLASDAIS